MIGLEVEGRCCGLSIASANYEENLEFLSIKVQNGPLTSRLQHLKEGDTILVSRKPSARWWSTTKPGKHLFLFGTGTGLAPFMSIIGPGRLRTLRQGHPGPRRALGQRAAYADFIGNELPNNEFFGEIVRDKLVYYPTVTREPFRNQGRITELLENGKLCQDIGIPQINPETDRAMICGSPHMLADISDAGCARLHRVPGVGQPGDYVVERAFVDKAPRRSRRTACSPKYKSPSHAMGFCWARRISDPGRAAGTRSTGRRACRRVVLTRAGSPPS